MTIRTLFAVPLALVLVAAAAPQASAQHVVYYTTPACQPVVYHSPVVYHQPGYTFGTPGVVQSGPWVNRLNVFAPESNRPFSRSAWNGEYADGFGFPFNNRPALNIAYRLAWR